MALSLIVLLVPLLLFVAAYRFLHQGDQPVVVDPGPAVAEARRSASFPVGAPEGLGEGWRPLSARFTLASEGDTLRIGYLTPSGAGVLAVQSDVDPEALLATELGDGPQPHGNESITDRLWQRYTARRGEVALVLAEPDRTVIVIGSAPVDEVRALAAAIP